MSVKLKKTVKLIICKRLPILNGCCIKICIVYHDDTHILEFYILLLVLLLTYHYVMSAINFYFQNLVWSTF